MTGVLYGVGVGPGDPELLTLKALRILQAAPVIAYIAPERGKSLARSIVEGRFTGEKIEIAIPMPMHVDPSHGQQVYDRYASEIAAHLKAGRDVAVLCEGDPLIFGSFMYLLERLGGDYPAAVTPGVSAVAAVAAVAAMPLASRNDTLVVVPATLPEARLEARLRNADAAAILKVGRHLDKVRRVLRRLALTETRYVEYAGMAGERMSALDEAGDKAPYFSMVLARKGKNVAVSPPEDAALVALGPSGLELARRLKEILPGSRLHGPEGAGDVDVTFSDAAAHFRTLFAQGTPIVGVCAVGILVRALAPLIADKRSEPPVVAVAVDGSAAVPIVGGHSGANRLARAIADATGGAAAVTTAGDARFGLAVDDPPPGWHCLNPEAAKGIVAALLDDRPVGLTVEAGEAGWLTESGASFAEGGDLSVIVTDRVEASPGNNLILHPQVLAVGVGCERGADSTELIELVKKTLADAGLSAKSAACVVSLDLKADEKAVHAAARALGVPARFFTAGELEELTPRLASPSEAVFKAVGCHGVAEGAALAAAGPDSALAVAKRGSRRATCAIARAPGVINPIPGRRQGRLAVVGIGPGNAAWRTPEATRVISEADDVVGYGLYLDMIGDLIIGKARHESKMTQEEKRARKALDLAAEGKAAVLVSSGDAGIYGLASLVFELLEREDRPEWNRLAISVVPGVSALQAAAARIGAPIGHDFCAISLSDLLTPPDDIERRLRAAADGDFVVALYNPVSNRRRIWLPAARDILLTARPKETPVVLARNLGRDEEAVRTITLGELTSDHADMLTLVLIGNSQTRVTKRGGNQWVFTPRGYVKKMKQK